MRAALLIIFISVSIIGISQTYYAEYDGTSILKPRVAVNTDSSSLNNAGLIQVLTPANMVITYKLRVHASSAYAYCEEEVIDGSLMGVSIKGEIFKYFIDLKKLVAYSYSEGLKISIIPKKVEQLKASRQTYHVNAIDGPDTAVLYFDTNIPKEIMGSVALSHNINGLYALKSSSNSFSLITWKRKPFDFEKEIKSIEGMKFKSVQRPFNLVFRAKYQQ